MNQLADGRVSEVIARMRDHRILIYGDLMLDEFIWGDVTRISPEAPVPVIDVRRESVRLGGAANVLANVLALGGRASLVGVIG
jgi:bifunctional ADP-heptose synthase (sugar kinase/adenylyltransferase)